MTAWLFSGRFGYNILERYTTGITVRTAKSPLNTPRTSGCGVKTVYKSAWKDPNELTVTDPPVNVPVVISVAV
jgi:hypothetical protein